MLVGCGRRRSARNPVLISTPARWAASAELAIELPAVDDGDPLPVGGEGEDPPLGEWIRQAVGRLSTRLSGILKRSETSSETTPVQ